MNKGRELVRSPFPIYSFGYWPISEYKIMEKQYSDLCKEDLWK